MENMKLINKQDVMVILKKNRFRFDLSQSGYSRGTVLWHKDLISSHAMTEIEDLQPVETSTKKTGYWVRMNDTGMYKCSECGGSPSLKKVEDGIIDDLSPFCPCCGIEILGLQSESDRIENHSTKEINEEEIPATGEWIIHINSIINTYYECSECGGTSSKNSKRCPHCDTKME